MTQIKGMVLDVVQKNDRFTNIIVKEMDSENAYYCSMLTNEFDVVVGTIYTFTLLFKVTEKPSETERRVFQKVIIKAIEE